jgi:hypothetical protein
MNVTTATLEQIYADIVNSVGYRMTVGPTDKLKVSRRRAGERTELPSARLARAAWRVAALLSPLVPPPPPPPPTTKLNPQTYNKGSSGQDARYCVTHDDGYRYDSGGREIDGRRSGKFVPGLKPADEMDGREPCDPYNGFPPWPAASYEV